jgi:hypothetical protein
MYRRMPRRLRAAYAAPMGPAALDLAMAPVNAASDTEPGEAPSGGGLPSPPAPTLDELDARAGPDSHAASGE